MQSTSPTQYALRLYLAVSTLILVFESQFESTSPGFVILILDGTVYGNALFAVAFLLGILALIDSVFNDVLTKTRLLRFIHEYRHILYLGIGITNAALIYVMLKQGLSNWFFLRFALDAIACVSVAIRDLYLRYIVPLDKQLKAEHA